jgi:hypothetical protein
LGAIMLRTFWTLAFLVVATTVRADVLTLNSIYDVAGTAGDGSKYSGTAQLKVISEKSFTIKWLIDGETYEGFGMRNDTALAATYTMDGKPGLIIYKIDGNGVMTGAWVVKGSNESGTEVLTPHK